MVSYGMPYGSLSFVIDVVPFDHMSAALDKVEKTCMETARQLQGPFINTKPVSVARQEISIPDRFSDSPEP